MSKLPGFEEYCHDCTRCIGKFHKDWCYKTWEDAQAYMAIVLKMELAKRKSFRGIHLQQGKSSYEL